VFGSSQAFFFLCLVLFCLLQLKKKKKTKKKKQKGANATPKSAKKVARLEDIPALSSKKVAATTMLQKVLGIAKFEMRDSPLGGHPFFQSSTMESSAKVRECYIKNLAKMADESKRKQFMDEFVQMCSSDARFPVAFLSPFQLSSKENQQGGREALAYVDPSFSLDKQDSLFRIFVQAPQVQKELIQWVLELLPIEPSLARLGLNNLRWLNNIHDSEAFARKLMECLQACDAPLQREIIHAIPEVIDDLGHKLTVEGLQTQMAEDPSFTGVILDTYSSLNMEASIVASIRDDLLKRLGSIAGEYLPSALKFLLQTTPQKALPNVINGIRNDLDLSRDNDMRGGGSVAVASAPGAPGLTPKQIKALNYQRLALEAIRTAMSFDEHICTAFLSSISSAKENKPLDFWILLIAHALTKMRVKVEAIVRKKVLSLDFSNSLVRRALAKNGSILIEQFPAVLAIADKAVRANEPSIVEFGVHLYCCAFSVFPDIFNRQNLVSNVLSHVGSTTSDSECGAGLNILVKLAEDAEQLKELWQFVETVLDNLVNLSKTNLRKAWKMFTALIWKGSHGGALDDKVYGPLCMVLRKQLTNMRDAYKRSGVIGAAAMVGQLSAISVASRKQQQQQHQPAQQQAISSEIAREFEFHVNALLSSSEPLYLALALDELALAIQLVPLSAKSLITKIHTRAMDLFESFVVECTEKSDIIGEAEVLFNLNGAETTTAMNFWSHATIKSRDHLVCLCPALNLVQTCTRKTSDGSLNDLGALTGAPLLLYPPNFMDTFAELTELDQTKVTVSVFHAINWIRECLNTFCEETDVLTNSMLMHRLTQMYVLEEQLEKCLCLRPCSLPNLRDPTGSLCAASSSVAAAEPAKKKAKAGAAKKKKKDGDEEGEAAVVDTGADLPRVRLLAPSFRALSLMVSGVMKFPSSSEEANDCAVLRPFAVHALLQNLDEYCQHLFELHAKRASSFGRKPKEIDLGVWNDPKAALSRVIMRIVPALAENLSRLGVFIANWAASDGVSWVASSEDAAAADASPLLPFDHDPTSDQTEERQRHQFWWFIMPSQRLIFDIFSRIFVWLDHHCKTASEDDAKALDANMRILLSHICGRKVEGGGIGSGADGLAEIKKESWRYLSSLCKSIQSLPTAVSFTAMLEALAMYGVGRKFAVPSHASTPIGSDIQSDALVPAGERAYLNELSKVFFFLFFFFFFFFFFSSSSVCLFFVNLGMLHLVA
jgi:hypothetical protein